MPHDPILADRVRRLLAGTAGLTEKKMFGGIGWMVGGNMAVGAHSDGRLMVRCAAEDFVSWVAEPGAGAMIHGGRPMSGWLLVDVGQVGSDAALATWVDRGRRYAASLPVK